MKQLFVGSHPNTVKFSDLDGRDRVCEIRVMIANAYTTLRDAIGEQAKNETNTFHGPWLVFRNLMNEHPAACLEEYRHAAIYFDADTEGQITEICDLIEQHIELTRQALSLKGVHQHQADVMIGISSTAGKMETTVMRGLGKTRGNNPHLIMADSVRKYIELTAEKESVFAFCVLLTKKLKSDCYDRYEDMTQEEMIECVHGLILASSQSVKCIREHVESAANELSMTYAQFVADVNSDFDAEDDQAADDENYALRN
ncbi:hypothetical protein pEaSNUABM30_00279 [Erwinia phage pEa_SNUABM_30]|uniref:Uncharacterized protein n=1 Tax=Erwinia phage pEa_SNUABM_30 TaxID=2869553 RepID=A0AAE8XM87_9CAUD|nr:hypothetical protein MPK69_gp279 [Erwinia phage pEa_SNUABM_30]UAW53397.1 hypothetical protein pEaSNUABM30_00279 [Erwinia phage pEa_SNUABM_30]